MPYWKAWLTPRSRGTQFARLSHLPSQSRIYLAASGFGTSIQVRWHHQQAMSLGLWQQVGTSTGALNPQSFYNLISDNSESFLKSLTHPFFWVSSSGLSRRMIIYEALLDFVRGIWCLHSLCISRGHTHLSAALEYCPWLSGHSTASPEVSTAPRVSQRKSDFFLIATCLELICLKWTLHYQTSSKCLWL